MNKADKYAPTIRLKNLRYKIKRKFKTHFHKLKTKDKIMSEMYNGYIKFNILMSIRTINGNDYKYPTSVTLKKNIVSLWLVMMEKIHCDHNKEIIDFIQNVCLKRWRGDTAKGLGDFVLKCMLHAIMEETDWENFKVVYKCLNGRVHNPKKIINTPHGQGCIKCEVPENPLVAPYKEKAYQKKSTNIPVPVTKKKIVFKKTKRTK